MSFFQNVSKPTHWLDLLSSMLPQIQHNSVSIKAGPSFGFCSYLPFKYSFISILPELAFLILFLPGDPFQWSPQLSISSTSAGSTNTVLMSQHILPESDFSMFFSTFQTLIILKLWHKNSYPRWVFRTIQNNSEIYSEIQNKEPY